MTTLTRALSLAPFCFLCASAAAQTQTIVSLPWTSGFSAGPLARDFPPSQDDRDIWVVEDFQTDRDWLIDEFSCHGTPTQPTDVRVVILDGLPGQGQIIMESTPGAGRSVPSMGWGRYFTRFDLQRLPAGSYYVMWLAQGTFNQLPPVMFVQAGAYSVGLGTPDNALQYNPGGGWNLPEGVLDPVTSDLDNMGDPIGVNFTITGVPAEPECRADFDGDGFLTGLDFDAYVAAFEAGDPSSDFDQDEFVTGLDFDAFVNAFETGC